MNEDDLFTKNEGYSIRGNMKFLKMKSEIADEYRKALIFEESQIGQDLPVRYWQHEETGRTCATISQPSERWYEITEEQYLTCLTQSP